MAVTFIKRSSIPVPVKGKIGTERVFISDKGQIGFSTLVTKHIGGKDVAKVALAFDADNRQVWVVPKGHKSVAKMPEDGFWDLRHARKGGTAMVSGGGSFLSNKDVFGDKLYDYKASGNQDFEVTTDKDGVVKFTLPVGGLTPKPKVARAPRKKKEVAPATSAAKATPDSVEAEELVLEPA